ncbi:sodium:solute symporter family transporter [Salinilacihabitans rarus]|uniref:sodium:solute symporter family transporter n=1 Tax=Salinilacihabitans rarus TaxID=2961596 RepID=UPI003CCCD5FE
MVEILLQGEAFDVAEGGFKLLPALILVGMLVLFLAVGWFFRVAAVDDLWVAGRSIGPIENGMAIGANWMSAASYLGVASLIALAGYFGLAYLVGWTTGYFILLIFMAAQFRRFGKYTAPDFIGDRFYSDFGRGLAALTTLLIAYVYAVGQGSGMGLMAQYIFGVPYEVGVVLLMLVTVGYVALSGMLGATKNMALQYVILIGAFLIGLYAVGWSQGFSSVLPYLQFGDEVAQVASLDEQFTEPFANAGYYTWVATCFTLIVGTCGLPHVLVRFYTVDNERTARWSTVWGLFFICLLYWGTAAYAAFAAILYEDGGYGSYTGMTGVEADATVVMTTALADLPQWLVGLVAAGAVAAALATVAGLFITASSAAAHDIYTNLIKEDASQREQLIVGRVAILVVGLLVTITALNPPGLIAELVAAAFAIAGTVFFPVFFLGLWWENTTREGAIAGMLVGLTLSFGSILDAWFLNLGDGAIQAVLPATSSALVGAPLVMGVIVVVSLVTNDPPEDVKRLVRQCHSPKPMQRTDSAEDVVGGNAPSDD